MEMTKRGWIFLIAILALVAIGCIIMFINIVYYGTTHSVEAKIKEEFYKDESIMSEYDEIISYKIEQVYTWQPDEDLPKDVQSGCYIIHVLALSKEYGIAFEQYYLCIVFYSTNINIIYRDVQLLDCDFTRIRQCDFEKIKEAK